MASLSIPLPPFDDDNKLDFDGLPPFRPQFFITRLKDKPQNPIIDSLPYYQRNKKSLPSLELKTLPKELLVLSEQVAETKLNDTRRDSNNDERKEDLWTTAGSEPRRAKV